MADRQLFVLTPPPRSTGNPTSDYPLLVDWVWKFYQAVTAYGRSQGEQAPFNPANLPDPASTNVANAQNTANLAYILADTANTHAATAQTTATTGVTNAATAQAAAVAAASAASAAQTTANTANNRTIAWVVGQVTVSGAATTAVHTFAVAQADTAYMVLLTPVSNTGTPDPDSNHVLTVTKTTANFTITVEAAPNVGNTVTYDFLVLR